MGHRLGDHASKGTILYVVSAPMLRPASYEWGETRHVGGSGDDIVFSCATKGRIRVLVAAPSHMRPVWKSGWVIDRDRCFDGVTFIITVSELEEGIQDAVSDLLYKGTQSEKELWIIYHGPKTDGYKRISGPWG